MSAPPGHYILFVKVILLHDTSDINVFNHFPNGCVLSLFIVTSAVINTAAMNTFVHKALPKWGLVS